MKRSTPFYLTSFKHAPTFIEGNVNAVSNKLTSLHNVYVDLPSVNGYLIVAGNRIVSHVLGVLLIENLEKVEGDRSLNDKPRWDNILNKYLSRKPACDGRCEMKDVYECQTEMIEEELDHVSWPLFCEARPGLELLSGETCSRGSPRCSRPLRICLNRPRRSSFRRSSRRDY